MAEIPGTGRLQDRIAVVTGSSGGIGRAICLRYAAEGAYVVCSDLAPGANGSWAFLFFSFFFFFCPLSPCLLALHLFSINNEPGLYWVLTAE